MQPNLTLPKYRAEIDGLRAVAVLAVVGYHAFPWWIRGGFTGVDVFFVISGFLISTIIVDNLESGTFSFRTFYERRIRRIFPALLAVLVANLALGWFVLLADEYSLLGQHVAAGAAFVSNLLLWSESGYFDAAAETKPLLHLWSLGIEEQFYIAWPLMLWLAHRRRWGLITLAATVGVASFILNVRTTGTDMVAAFYSPLSRLWELALGSLLALAGRGDPRLEAGSSQALANGKALLGAAMIGTGLFAIHAGRSFPGWWVLLPAVGTALLISAGRSAWLNRRVFASPALVWFGLISYPLYLWHWSLLTFARIVEGGVPPTWIRGCAVLASIALAWATYRWIERPIRHGARWAHAKAIALLVGMIAIASVGYGIHALGGLAWRGGANLVMDEGTIVAQRKRHWGADKSRNYDRGAPKIVLFGDSQSFDVFTALANDPRLGLRHFSSTYQCAGFDIARAGQETYRAECEKSWRDVLKSHEIKVADVLVYAREFYPGLEAVDNLRMGIAEVHRINPGLRIVIFGNKPKLGRTWLSINAITRKHRSLVGMNEYLNTIRFNGDAGNAYGKEVATSLGVGFVDTEAVFCDGGCPFFVDNRFSYFDTNHWTEAGARVFQERLSKSASYRDLLGGP